MLRSQRHLQSVEFFHRNLGELIWQTIIALNKKIRKQTHMKKNMILVFLFFSCTDSSLWHYHLGDSFFYLKSGGAMEVDTYKGDGITYKSLFDDPIVFPTIENYKFNNNFIVCKQNYSKNLTNDLLQSAFEFRYHEIEFQTINKGYQGITNYIREYEDNKYFYNRLKKLKNKNRFGFTKPLTDSIVKNNNLFVKMEKQKMNYYIIDKKRKNNYLVLSNNEFKKLFLKLKIPDSLDIN